MRTRMILPLITVFAAVLFVFAEGGQAMQLRVGNKAPDFILNNPEGKPVHLGEVIKKNYAVLIFYPGDETAGCTKQLCAVRDDWTKFEARQVQVFGINPADTASHRKFAEHHGFPFPLLADPGRKTAKAYGCTEGPFVRRTVFVIDPHGIIVYAKRGMPADDEILQAVPMPAQAP